MQYFYVFLICGRWQAQVVYHDLWICVCSPACDPVRHLQNKQHRPSVWTDDLQGLPISNKDKRPRVTALLNGRVSCNTKERFCRAAMKKMTEVGSLVEFWRMGSEVAAEYKWWLDRIWIQAKCPGEAIDLWEEMRVPRLQSWCDMDKKMIDVNVHHVITVKMSLNKTQTLKQLLHMSLAWLRTEEWMSKAGMLESSELCAHGVHLKKKK